MAILSQRVVQLGKQSTYSFSAAAATVKLAGITEAQTKIADKVEPIVTLGGMAPAYQAVQMEQHAEGSLNTLASYEDIRYLLNGIFAASTLGTGASAPYTYRYEAPTTATLSNAIYTLEHGTSDIPYEVNGVLFKTLNIKGSAGGFWEANVDYIAQRVSTSTGLTPSLSDRQITPIRMADTVLYIDAFSTATIGTSTHANFLIDFDLNVDTKRHNKVFAGSLYPGAYGDDRWEGSLKITGEFGSTMKAFIDNLMSTVGASIAHQVYLVAGTTVGPAGSSQNCTVSFAGYVTDGVELYKDRDGNITAELTYQGVYSTGLTNWLKITVGCFSSATL